MHIYIYVVRWLAILRQIFAVCWGNVIKIVHVCFCGVMWMNLVLYKIFEEVFRLNKSITQEYVEWFWRPFIIETSLIFRQKLLFHWFICFISSINSFYLFNISLLFILNLKNAPPNESECSYNRTMVLEASTNLFDCIFCTHRCLKHRIRTFGHTLSGCTCECVRVLHIEKNEKNNKTRQSGRHQIHTHKNHFYCVVPSWSSYTAERKKGTLR